MKNHDGFYTNTRTYFILFYFLFIKVNLHLFDRVAARGPLPPFTH